MSLSPITLSVTLLVSALTLSCSRTEIQREDPCVEQPAQSIENAAQAVKRALWYADLKSITGFYRDSVIVRGNNSQVIELDFAAESNVLPPYFRFVVHRSDGCVEFLPGK